MFSVNVPSASVAGYKNTFMNVLSFICSWKSLLVFILIEKYVEAKKARLELGEQ